MKKVCSLSIIVSVVVLLSCADAPRSAFDVDAALDQCHRQINRALVTFDKDFSLKDPVMPRNVQPGDSVWSCRPLCAEEWCSGFWPGILWLDYEARRLAYAPESDYVNVRHAAIGATEAMKRILDRPVLDHDLGFLIFCSAGTGMRVLQRELSDPLLPDDVRESDEKFVEEYSNLCMRAADSLATLFRPAVGTILSWPRNVEKFGGHNTIMDNMINLELLCWTQRPEHLKIAISHASTTLKHHFRDDATCYHVAVYDTLDGHFIHGVTHQGLADSSTWARGQAWAVYGFTMMAREMKQREGYESEADAFLQQACGAADAFISHLPADHIPFWDFDDPRIATSPGDRPSAPSSTIAPRDASAGAVVASALLELSTLVDNTTTARHYFDTAESMLQSLSSAPYQASSENCAFLLHSTGSLPANSEVDIPIIYADYYYIEALLRYKALTHKATP
ncbi:MAG: glycoside hydrolase family 88 protein [Bacteroidales bacterium]|nr:glycoside hydrolase family 88 protein [Bacteroidales bacterium]